ncbi:single-stranded-DNA-specific exonuclease RecJ [Motiliproteus sp. SC1-56]|uniref:single-stranded-DNA-specific exonuclease RecJ n=1 Tax=Motiliproteus sp. SC1-56 TaxID=2799565 RepID=UPI001A8DA9F3|nr:single-stranded-DNA-specific exonuclease RecJ [Motiliproteus sp. SC1-56]
MNKRIVRRPAGDSGALSGTDLPPLLQRIYSSRGIRRPEELDRSLKVLHPYHCLQDIDRAVEEIGASVVGGERILVVGDFDCDGATSSALAVLALRAMGAAWVDFLVPNRFEYGYGLSREIVAVAAQQHPHLLITVDNGISSIDGVAAAREAGMRVVVTDHHLPGEELPAAQALVNPNRADCNFPSKHTCGVGVIFYVMSALRRWLEARGWFADQGIPMPNMADFLDLVALGTVADVVALDQNNRALVEQGLRRIRARRARPGLLALLEVAGRNPAQLVAADLGFAVGPRLNAAGRLEDMAIGIRCLLTDDPDEARRAATELDALNRQRREIEQDMQQQALAALEAMSLDDQGELPYGVCLFDESWHEGVIGILASRIKERLHRPVIAFADAGRGQIKGSARSIPGLHIRDALDAVAARHPEVLSKFGGHAMAAGMTLHRDQLETFRQAFDAEARRHLDAAALEARLESDGELKREELTLEMAVLLRNAGPWGQQFPEPRFDGCFELLQQRIVGQRHLKLVVQLPGTGFCLDAIAFNVDLDVWPSSADRARLAYRLDINQFRGKTSLQLVVDHLEPL